MDSLLKNKILQRTSDSDKSIRKQYNLDGERMNEAVNILREWIKQQPHILKKDFSSNYLEMAIISSKGSLEKAKKIIDARCTFRTLMPKYFGVQDIKKLYQENLKGRVYAVILPKQTEDCNYRFYIGKVMGNVYTRENMFHFYRYCITICDYVFNNDCMNGMIFVHDLLETSITDLLASANFMDMKNMLHILIEAYGVRVKAIHIITKSAAVDALNAIIKPWLGKKMASRLSVISSPEELGKMYPRDILPKEYGGTQGPIADIFERWVDVLSSVENMKAMKDMDRAATDESLRANDVKFNEEYAGIAGTFRFLTVD